MARIKLASYSDGGADKVMAGLANAATGCKGFNGSGGAEGPSLDCGQLNVLLHLCRRRSGPWVLSRDVDGLG